MYLCASIRVYERGTRDFWLRSKRFPIERFIRFSGASPPVPSFLREVPFRAVFFFFITRPVASNSACYFYRFHLHDIPRMALAETIDRERYRKRTGKKLQYEFVSLSLSSFSLNYTESLFFWKKRNISNDNFQKKKKYIICINTHIVSTELDSIVF